MIIKRWVVKKDIFTTLQTQTFFQETFREDVFLMMSLAMFCNNDIFTSLKENPKLTAVLTFLPRSTLVIKFL